AELSSWVRLLLTAGLIFVWATPVVVAISIWSWMIDFEFGVANWTLTKLGLGNFNHHDWLANPWSGWGVIISLIVWGAIPFVAITLYAGLTLGGRRARAPRLPRDHLPGLLDGRDRVQAGVGDHRQHTGLVPDAPDAVELLRCDPQAVLLDVRQEQPDRCRLRRHHLARPGLPRRARAGEVPLLRPEGVHGPDNRRANGPAERADHPDLPGAREVEPGRQAQWTRPHLPDLRAAVH